MALGDLTFYDIIQRNALFFQNRPAWREADDGSVTTYAEFKNDVDRLAQALLSAGVRPGDRIGVIGKNSLPYFLLLGAAAAVGAVVVLINWRLAPEEAAYNLNDTQPCIVLAEADDDVWLKKTQSHLTGGPHFFNLNANDGPFDRLPAQTSPPRALPAVTADNGLVIIHTAAVGGRPRGALLSQRNLLLSNLHLISGLGTTPRDINLNLLPLFHISGLAIALQTFHAGALNLNMRKFDADQAVRLIDKLRVTMFFDFAPILKSILDAQERAQSDFSSLRAVMGLDAVETIERFQGVAGGAFYCIYGQTETSLLATTGPYNDCPGAAGRPLPMANVAIVDENDHPVAPGAVGEIVVQGPLIFKGYWNLPQDNAEVFRNGWHHTGDLGRLDQNGFLWYAGRKPEKELIKPGGENVYPAEVEKVIMEHPAIAAVVVFGVPDPKWKEGIKAVCVLKPQKQCSAQELIDFVGQRIARYKKPQYVTFIDQMPLNPAGAVDRAQVKQMYGGI